MRRATLFRVSIGATALLGTQAAIASVTFNGSQTVPWGVGTESAVYSITTDGMNGTLSDSDILSWTVKLSGSGLNKTYSSSGGALDTFGSVFSESGSNLLFDFGTNGGSNATGYAIFWDSGMNNWFCFQRNACWDFSGGAVGIDYNAKAERGVQVIATAGVMGGVPEPATWAMMLIGFGGMGYAMRRRRAAVPQLA